MTLVGKANDMDQAKDYFDNLIAQGYPPSVAESFTATYFPGFLVSNSIAKNQETISQNNFQNFVPETIPQSTLNSNPQNNHISYPPYSQQTNNIGVNDGLYIVTTQTGKSNTSKILVITVISVVAIVAITVVLAGVLYVWAANLAEDNQDQSIEGSWYNTADTITFYPNGTVTESTNTFINWQITDGDLVFEYLLEDTLYEIALKYTIRDDTNGNEILFIAYYDYVDGEKTSNLASNLCFSYSSSVLGSDADYAETARAVIPTWCEFAEE